MRIGIVGYGAGGSRFHLPFIEAIDEWQIVGVVTRSPKRRAQLEYRSAGMPVFDTMDELIDAGVDVVVLTTPPATRRELVLRALERGVNVVADKPFAPDAQIAKELIAAAKDAGKLLTVYQNRRWDSDFLTLRRVVESGELGSIWRANFVLDMDEPGSVEADPNDGLLRDLGAHLVDQAIQLLGPVARVSGHLDFIGSENRRTDVGFALGLHHTNGAFSQVAASKMCGRTERTMTIYGEHGSYGSRMNDVQVDQISAGLTPRNNADTWGVPDSSVWGELRTPGTSKTVVPEAGNHAEFYRQLYRALVEGTPAPVQLFEALHTVQVLDAARASALQGKTLSVQQ